MQNEIKWFLFVFQLVFFFFFLLLLFLCLSPATFRLANFLYDNKQTQEADCFVNSFGWHKLFQEIKTKQIKSNQIIVKFSKWKCV